MTADPPKSLQGGRDPPDFPSRAASPCSACLYVDAQVRCLDCGRPLCLEHLPLHYCHAVSETRLIDRRVTPG